MTVSQSNRPGSGRAGRLPRLDLDWGDGFVLVSLLVPFDGRRGGQQVRQDVACRVDRTKSAVSMVQESSSASDTAAAGDDLLLDLLGRQGARDERRRGEGEPEVHRRRGLVGRPDRSRRAARPRCTSTASSSRP